MDEALGHGNELLNGPAVLVARVNVHSRGVVLAGNHHQLAASLAQLLVPSETVSE